jgi:hypothetical protein
VSGQHLTQSAYTLQLTVGLFLKLHSQLEEASLTHTYRVVLHFCQLDNIDYLVLRYVNTSAPPFDQWAEEWLHEVEL